MEVTWFGRSRSMMDINASSLGITNTSVHSWWRKLLSCPRSCRVDRALLGHRFLNVLSVFADLPVHDLQSLRKYAASLFFRETFFLHRVNETRQHCAEGFVSVVASILHRACQTLNDFARCFDVNL